MGKESELISIFSDRGIMKGGELLIPKKVAEEFIRACESEGLVIIGIDFFRRHNSEILPTTISADFSVLLSSADPVSESVKAARALIKSGYPDQTDLACFVLEQVRK